jgi:ribose transport system substrate-binding protein
MHDRNSKLLHLKSLAGQSNRRRTGPLGLAVLGLIAVLALTACGKSSSSGSSSGDSGSTTASTQGLGQCGTYPEPAPNDPEGAIAALPEHARTAYVGAKIPTYKSAWVNLREKGPWKMGFSGFAPINAFTIELREQLEREFAKAKTAGLVTGELHERVMASAATQTPAEQISDYDQLVSEGNNLIFVHALSSEAMVKSINEAGKKGVVTVMAFGGPTPSKYSIGVNISNYLITAIPAAAVAKQVGGKGNVLVIHGIPAISVTKESNEALEAVLERCPEMKVAGEINGEYSIPTTKSETLKFLASHPEPIVAGFQGGNMGPGVVAGFEQAGREVPPVIENGALAGGLGWWVEHLEEGYESAGAAVQSKQIANAMFRVALRTLSGRGPKLSEIWVHPTIINNKNVEEFVEPGTELSDPGQTIGPDDGLVSEEELDEYFEKPGTPESLSE